MEINNKSGIQEKEQAGNFNPSRRQFLTLAGGVAGVGLLLSAASCRKTPASATYIGEGDIALLNYLYILKQVTSKLYAQAVSTTYNGITKEEVVLQVDLRDQEVAHREFLKKLLDTKAVKEIATDLSQVTFADKKSFLNHACILEDLSVGAYTGVLRVLTSDKYKLTLAKMASVDARHAGYMHDLQSHGSFGSLDGNGLDKVIAPATGFATLESYIETKFDARKLPTF